MEHDTTLWTSPYNSKQYGIEKGASWKYFQEFIKMPSPRTLIGFHEQLSNDLSNKGRKRIPSYQTIREYSSAWKWMMRAKAYDEYMNHLHDEEMAEKIKAIREKAIGMIDDRFDYHKQLQKDLESDMEMATNQKIYGFAKNSEGFRNDVSSLNELANEGRTKLDANVDADVKQDIKQESKDTVTIFDEVDKQLGLDIDDSTGDKGHSDNSEG